MKGLPELGENQFKQFWEKRLVTAEVPISDEIKKNQIRLPKHMLDRKDYSEKDAILTTKTLSYLRSAYEFRKDEVKELFCSEIFGIAQSISLHSTQLYNGTKSEIARRFTTTSVKTRESKYGIVIELSPIIQSKQVNNCSTFDDFARVVYNHIVFLSRGYDRCDVVADRYFTGSLKEGTRKKRGDTGSTMQFTGETRFPSSFSDFLSNSENKNNLGQFLARKMIDLHNDSPCKFVVTFNDTILTNDTNLASQSDIKFCTAEEADPRLIRHAMNQAVNGIKCITIETVDSDVLVLSIGHIENLIAAGASNAYIRLAKKEYDLIEIFEMYGPDTCKALPYFHAFTGCDTASSFFGKGKTTMFDAWMIFPKLSELNSTFIELSNSPTSVSKENLKILEEFMLFVYFGKDHKYTDINDARCTSFFKSPDPKLKETILSRDALFEHVKRSTYQAGWLWKECLVNVILPDPRLWGWKTNTGSHITYIPQWETNTATVKLETIISICSCKTNRCTACKCGTASKKCLIYCNCQRKCKNVSNLSHMCLKKFSIFLS